MSETPPTITLRRDQIFGLYAHLEARCAGEVAEYFEECREPCIVALAEAARLDREGMTTVIFPGRLAGVRARLSDYGAEVVGPTGSMAEGRRFEAPVDSLIEWGHINGDDSGTERVAPAFSTEDVPALIRMATDDELHRAPSSSDAVWAPLHAVRALGELHAAEAIEPLIALWRRPEAEHDDFLSPTVAEALGVIGAAVVEPVAKFLADETGSRRSRGSAARVLRMVGVAQPKLRDLCVRHLVAQLAAFEVQDQLFNASLVSELIDLRTVEAASEIEKAFVAGRVDEMVCGDWEDVQIELGLKLRRERPRKPNEFTEMGRKFREALGLPEIDELAGPGQIPPIEAPDRVPLSAVPFRAAPKVGRNEPCPCGSGKKFKKCCGP